MAHKAQNIYYVALYRKILPTPAMADRTRFVTCKEEVVNAL